MIIMKKDKLLYCCYSVPLKEFLTQQNIEYELCALNPNTKCMFWAYVRNEKLNKCLKEWSKK